MRGTGYILIPQLVHGCGKYRRYDRGICGWHPGELDRAKILFRTQLFRKRYAPSVHQSGARELRNRNLYRRHVAHSNQEEQADLPSPALYGCQPLQNKFLLKCTSSENCRKNRVPDGNRFHNEKTRYRWGRKTVFLPGCLEYIRSNQNLAECVFHKIS